MMKLRSVMLLAGMAAVVAVAGVANAAEKLKFAHVYEVSEPYHAQALWAAKEISTRTKGRYEIDVFPASSLGKETDINQALSLGTIDMIYTGNLFAGSSYGPLSIAGAPFMFRDLAHWKAYAKSDLFKDLANGYQEKTGNKIIATTYYGSRHVTSNKPIQTPADMKNLKIRVPNSPLYMMFPKAVGANPTPLAFAEVYLALQQGVVDAQENPLPTIQAKKFYEVQKYITLTGHIRDSLLTIASGSRWKRLSDADKAIFTDVFSEAAARASTDIEKSESTLAAWFEKQGVKVNSVNVTPFREATMKLHNGPDATWSKETYDRLQAIK